MRYQDKTHYRITRGATIRAVAFIVLVVLGSSTALANQPGTPVSPAGTPTAGGSTPVPDPGPPRYPDLVALPPDDLYFSTELLDDGRRHTLLRFSSSVANTGEGPLELAGSTEPGSAGDVFQVVYDAAKDGTAVERRHLGTDLIFHPEHHHFHLANFATYELLRVEPDGDLVPTGEGGKQSSCLLDTLPLTKEPGSYKKSYYDCELERQGLSVGWMDTYAASLPDQWVDLGSEPLADGTYILRYTVDPLHQLAEDGRTDNNVAETRFTVGDGEIVGRPEPPRCSIEGDSSGPVGATVTVRCSHFPEHASIDVYWGAWDPWAPEVDPIASFHSLATTAVIGTFQVPDVEPGSYPVALVAPDYEEQVHVSATVIYGVLPGGAATPVATPEAEHRHD